MMLPDGSQNQEWDWNIFFLESKASQVFTLPQSVSYHCLQYKKNSTSDEVVLDIQPKSPRSTATDR